MADLSKMRFLKRFTEDKHDQILQVMSYLQMCGLSGRDIVSIGGWIDRSRTASEYRSHKERVQTFINQRTIRPIGQDRKDQIVNRFKYKGLNGDYNFVQVGWSSGWEVYSVRTKVKKPFRTGERNWPSHLHWNQRQFYDCVLDIADDSSWLNF